MPSRLTEPAVTHWLASPHLPPPILVVGDGPGRLTLAQGLRAAGDETAVVGILADEAPAGPVTWPHLGDVARLAEVLRTTAVGAVALCLRPADWSRFHEIAETCASHGVPLTIPLPPFESAHVPSRDHRVQWAMKRLMDVAVAATCLVLFAPVLGATAAAILALDGRPVLFRQRRAGLGGRPFEVVKFRTMDPDADHRRHELRVHNAISGAAFKMEDDPRVTRLGRWLRRMSLDELPQLWNVLRNEMSLVGPRPHPYDDVAGYQPWHLRRLAAKPGITGLWQIELRDDPDFDRWVAKDIEYIERWSIWVDIGILVRTIPAVLRGSGR